MAQYALPLFEPKASRKVRQTTLPQRRRLWFCVYLPNLPLEAVASRHGAEVVVEEQHGIHRVVLADEKAEKAGILAGQSVNAACALLPTVTLIERSGLAEQQALEKLAAWLEQFTSVVCFDGTSVLLLEIAGSLRLYGGLLNLRQQLLSGLEQQGFTAFVAIAPTPLAATWLARGGRRACVRELSNLAKTLRTLPLACLEWPASVHRLLTGMGIKTIGDCLRLPREGFARRFGPGRLLELDRALGQLPDPRTSWRAPERFCADYEMTEEHSDREILLSICRELLQQHERFLLARQLGSQQLLFSFFHLRAPATQLPISCARAERMAEHWFDLLRLRFEQLSLPEPVIAVRLYGGHTQAFNVHSSHLRFNGKPAGKGLHYSMSQLAERLTARVGKQSVQGFVMVAEHRPQLAWRHRDLLDRVSNAASIDGPGIQRPLWILPEPVLLPVEDGYPFHQGRLQIISGPERLETGWWDADGVSRDYYTAANPRGIRLWIFQNRSRERSWYLQGLFG
jgi:protein ImuB